MNSRVADSNANRKGKESNSGFATLNDARNPSAEKSFNVIAPSVSLPKGGGAIRGLGEKFTANPVSGTCAMTVPIGASPGRSGFGPQLALSYDSGAGNGPFGFGWRLSLPSITRKTDKGLPRYRDADESDVFMLSGAEDLVPVLDAGGRPIVDSASVPGFIIQPYRPRIEAGFARIERWTRQIDRDVHWRTLSSDNVLAIYGKDGDSRIADPADSRHIFTWLLSETRDDRGNVILFEYKREDAGDVDVTQAHEVGRGDGNSPIRKANRYIKQIRYGNRVPLLDAAGRRPIELAPQALQNAGWMFEIVFDYGEHSAADPKPGDAGTWLCRNDPFSSYRSGFEVRTYRLCQRVLMFHHFPAEPGIGQDCLVRSTGFAYREIRGIPDDHRRGHPIASFIASIAQSGYIRANGGGYTSQSLPPVTFEYSQAVISSYVQQLDAGSLENLPAGIDGINYQLIDLNGEGLAGVLTEQVGAWYYKPNLGEGKLGLMQCVASRPTIANLAGGRQMLMDLAADGQIDLVQFDAQPAGYFKRTANDDWESFVPFAALPNVDWASPNLRLIDLNGDGHPDLLLTEDEVFTWYPSRAEAGFGSAERLPQSVDEERGPRLVLDDDRQSIFLADMTGDGLTDLVRIQNGQVVYWPNVGYGRFGAKVTMTDAPWFDQPDQFDPRRIRLADIDGSGVIDILYIGAGEVRLWLNQSGNSWSAPRRLPDFPHLDDLSDVQAADLLGNGTACLVWSSPRPTDAQSSLQYIDLMGGIKPHLLVNVSNNLGAETRIRYAASTKFYLADREAGRPWITRLPFPVHVVEQVECIDHISRSRFVSRYSYHHGYFDGVEREFRGFAMVEQQDTEAFEDYVEGVAHIEGTQELAPEFYQPPVTTRTWYHTGAYLDGERILHQLRNEYYLQQQHTPEPVLSPGMDEDEYRECVRALKGLPLRQEIYSFDGSPQAQHPYSVAENNYDVKLLQPRAGNRHAVFFTYGCETITHYYERNPADPRVAHTLNLEIGPVGNVVKSASVVYGRKVVDPTLPTEVTRDQQQMRIVYGESDYTPDIDQQSPVPVHRLRTPYESRGYDITGIAPAAGLFTLADLKGKIAGAAVIDYEVVASGAVPQNRLVSQSRSLFRDNNLAPMSLGQWDTLALGYESYRLAFTPGVTAAYYSGHISDADFTEAGYVHFNNDANWWIPSGIALYPNNPASHFYLPNGSRDALSLETIAILDQYDLLPERVRITQAVWSEVRATNDYRVLGPVMMVDPNQNRTAVEIDALGMVVKSAVMGKAGAGEGDTLADPTVRMEYDLFNWMKNAQPTFAHVFAREKHGAVNPRWQESYVYSNGSGGVAMVKAQAHPGKALRPNPGGTVTEVNADPRWVGNGRTILNNKGNPVKQYEPFFSTTHEYEDEEGLTRIGFTPIFYYDAAGRNVRTDFPNGAFALVTFDPWVQRNFDANDTVLQSRWYTDRGSPDPNTQPEPLNDPERRAAWLAARHASTPGTVHIDSLGRPVYAVSDYSNGITAAVRSEADLTGRYAKMFDQQKRQIASGFTGMAGSPIYGESAEKGRRWTFINALGALLRAWDEYGRAFRADYDPLHRPVGTYVQEPGKNEILFNYVVYGDRHPNAVALNLLGGAHQVFDQAGMLRVQAQDFKGNPLTVERMLARDYTNNPNWSALPAQPDYAAIQAAANPTLETAETFTAGSTYDALNRPVQVALHGGTVMAPAYNEANFLASLKVQIEGQGPFVEFLKEQDYDAKGQRQFAHYGNDVLTNYFYDAQTFRLTNLLTVTAGDPNANSLQDLKYTYDPVGNITQVRDDAQQTHFFGNAVVKPDGRYEYDAIYQLIKATGREHAGSANDNIRDGRDVDFVPQLPHVNNTSAVRNYTENYEYDLLGNLLRMSHATSGAAGNWTRRYHYAYQDDPTNKTNRLTSTSRPGDPDPGPYTATYDYDHYGNMTRLRSPTPGELVWNFMDQLQQVDLGGGGTAYYVYSVAGQRVRKVIERLGALRTERIYLGALEIYRERQGNNAPHFERRTLHIADNAGRIAQVDVKTRDDNNADPANPLNMPLIRYQYGNHLGSAVLETDDQGTVISYEEYHPFGTTAYHSSKSSVDLSLKRYRFSGKERDDETGLYYVGARYYAPWLGRWTSSDPGGFIAGLNLYCYCSNNPVVRSDPDGMQDVERCYYMHPSLGVMEALGSECHAPGMKHVTSTGEPIPEPAKPAGGTTPGAGSTTSTGANVVQKHPEGPIHEVAQNFDDAKIAAYQDRIQTDRGVAIRSSPAGSNSRTADLRAANQQLRNGYEAGLPGGQRPPGTDIDHVVELQDIGRHNNTVRPQDHRVQNSRLNSSQGSSQQKVNSRRIGQGIPEDVPAGAVARGAEMGNPRIQPGYRAGVRAAGYGFMFLGPILTWWGASKIENTGVRRTGYGLATAEGAGALTYIFGRIFMGGGAAGSTAGLRAMGLGGGLARFAGGLAAILLGTYSLINDIQRENYGTTPGDAASIVAGGAILAGSAPVAAIAAGVGAANIVGDWVESKVTPAYGRTAGVAAGTLAGAGIGAAIGAGIGVWFFGVGAAPAAVVGGAIGAVVGFIGAFW
jgi:RHS repeat-associated protein